MINPLENARKKRGYTQEQMARKLEIAVSTYNQYEKSARNVPVEIAEKISNILETDMLDIFLPKKFTISKNIKNV